MPPRANVKALRQTTPLFGSGLIEAVPDVQIKAYAALQAATHPEQAGRIHKLALKRQPADAPALAAPVAARRDAAPEPAEPRRNPAREARAKAWADQLAEMAGDRPEVVLLPLDGAAHLERFAAVDDDVRRDDPRRRVARTLLAAKSDQDALHRASTAAARRNTLGFVRATSRIGAYCFSAACAPSAMYQSQASSGSVASARHASNAASVVS